MKHWIGLAGLSGLSLVLGCAPSTEKICGKVAELVKHDAVKSARSFEASDKQRALERCEKRMTDLQRDDEPAYKCAARCIAGVAVNSLKLAESCATLCKLKTPSFGFTEESR